MRSIKVSQIEQQRISYIKNKELRDVIRKARFDKMSYNMP